MNIFIRLYTYFILQAYSLLLIYMKGANKQPSRIISSIAINNNLFIIYYPVVINNEYIFFQNYSTLTNLLT